MRYARLGRAGPTISVIGAGAWAAGGDWGPLDDEAAIAAICRAADLGINWVDTAPAYGFGHSERVVARALRQLPDDRKPMVFTKCSRVWDDNGRVYGSLDPASLRAECEQSLRRLEVEAIDLYQIHQPEPETDIEDAWETLQQLQREGKIRYAGVSNFDVGQLSRINRIATPTALQPPYSLVDRAIEEDVLPYCIEHGIGTIAWSPLARGLLAGTHGQESLRRLPPGDTRRTDPLFVGPESERHYDVADRVRHLAAEHGANPAALAVAWTIRSGGVSAAIVGMRRPAHADSIVAAADLVLNRATLDALDAA
jgi:aryl-alcohol dehydrogenase-like predicted oxidoreductase